MQRQRQFHHPQVRAQVPAVLGQDGDQLMPDLLRQLLQLVQCQFLDVRRTVHHLEISAHVWVWEECNIGVLESRLPCPDAPAL